MDRVSILQRLAGGFAVIGVILALSAAITGLRLSNLSHEFDDLSQTVAVFGQVGEIQEDLGEARMFAFAYRAAGGDTRIEEVRSNLQEAVEVTASLRNAGYFSNAEVSALETAIRDYGRAFGGLVGGDPSQAERLDTIGPEMLAMVEAKYDRINASVDTLKLAYRTDSAMTMTLLVALTVLGLLVAGVLAVLIVRSLTGPLTALIQRIQAMADGDLESATPHTDLRDALGDLARAQDTLRTRLGDAKALEDQTREQTAQQVRRAEALEALVAEFEAEAERNVDSLSGAGGRLRDAARALTDITSSAETQATSVASSAEESSASVQTVASSAEELAASIEEILRAARETASSVTGAHDATERSSDDLSSMLEAVEGMASVLETINQVAEQTNLLALNATIEAARAGEAGKGFAVVAEEVKALAGQTQSLTEQINSQIADLKSRSASVTQGSGAVGAALNGIKAQAVATTSTAEQQTSAVREISASAQDAASGAGESSAGVIEISQSISAAAGEARTVAGAADEVADLSSGLRTQIGAFLAAVKAA